MSQIIYLSFFLSEKEFDKAINHDIKVYRQVAELVMKMSDSRELSKSQTTY